MNSPRHRLGVVMDPIETIHPRKDSTLAMLLAAQKLDWQIVYFRQRDLSVRDGVARGEGQHLTVADHPECWFELGGRWSGELNALDVILMRKDPPFNMEYVYTTYILQLAEQRGALVVNRSSSLREINEKAYTAWFPHCTPPSVITRSEVELRGFLQEHTKIVLKPLDGMGGRAVFVVAENDINANVIIETLTDYGTRFIIGQRYVPEIVNGDKRILLIDGVPIDFALARIPAPGESRGNLVMGATGEGRELTERDRWICAQVGPALVEHGVMFAGIDVIGDYLTEINVTSPTGIRELDRQYGIDIAGKLMTAILGKLEP
ncbi:glutathione synthase [Candidatus Rariloculus sp.]|uniref:glutathione synthase n=1 Tax=Candidatus Rariloculus sp. TaxID=3101265 RepID=UPI003D13ADBE